MGEKRINHWQKVFKKDFLPPDPYSRETLHALAEGWASYVTDIEAQLAEAEGQVVKLREVVKAAQMMTFTHNEDCDIFQEHDLKENVCNCGIHDLRDALDALEVAEAGDG